MPDEYVGQDERVNLMLVRDEKCEHPEAGAACLSCGKVMPKVLRYGIDYDTQNWDDWNA